MTIPIEVGTRVTLNFALVLEDGEVVDSNFDAPPASFTIGDGNLLPGFEEPLVGLSSGDENEFLIAPEKAFGQHNPQNVQSVERDNFNEDELEVGLVLSFQNGDGELPGVVIALSDDEVMVDFNHPLAGQSIVFRVKIFNVEPVSVH
ncbi:MAG: peptidylprolyl isomerase [Porticoccaceae bacterium]|nr:peptidylprolyl isomerase [Porticoccaceae bacterium]